MVGAATLLDVNQVDLAVLTLVLLFAYKGYRTGLVSVVLGLTGALLAFGLAAVMAPLLAPLVSPFVSERLGLPVFVVRPGLVVALTAGLRFLLGFAVRELVSAVRLVVRAIPPLAWLDRLLGVLPSAGLGAALALALVLVARQLPLGPHNERLLDDAWVVRNLLDQPERTTARLRDLGGRLLTDPPRVNGFVISAGVAGLALAGLAASRLRGPISPARSREGPARRSRLPLAAEVETADPLALVRLTFGVGVALAMAAGLVFLGVAR